MKAAVQSAERIDEHRAFEVHLVQCDGCHDYVEQLRRTVGAMGRIEPEALPAAMRAGLLATFRAWRAA